MESIQKTIIENGTAISSQEALSDIAPINWSKDVLDGKYKNKTIIKCKYFVAFGICTKSRKSNYNGLPKSSLAKRKDH